MWFGADGGVQLQSVTLHKRTDSSDSLASTSTVMSEREDDDEHTPLRAAPKVACLFVCARFEKVYTGAWRQVVYASHIVGPGVYFIGVIDFLQVWDWRKRAELFLRILFQGHCT